MPHVDPTRARAPIDPEVLAQRDQKAIAQKRTTIYPPNTAHNRDPRWKAIRLHGPEGAPVGYGLTKQAAIDDLNDQLTELGEDGWGLSNVYNSPEIDWFKKDDVTGDTFVGPAAAQNKPGLTRLQDDGELAAEQNGWSETPEDGNECWYKVGDKVMVDAAKSNSVGRVVSTDYQGDHWMIGVLFRNGRTRYFEMTELVGPIEDAAPTEDAPPSGDMVNPRNLVSARVPRSTAEAADYSTRAYNDDTLMVYAGATPAAEIAMADAGLQWHEYYKGNFTYYHFADPEDMKTALSVTQSLEEAKKPTGHLSSLIAKAQAEEPKLRRVSDHEYRDRKATVFKDPEWGEFRVKFYVDGEHLVDADYHTDDKADATGTAKHWIAQAQGPTTEAAGDIAVPNDASLGHLKGLSQDGYSAVPGAAYTGTPVRSAYAKIRAGDVVLVASGDTPTPILVQDKPKGSRGKIDGVIYGTNRPTWFYGNDTMGVYRKSATTESASAVNQDDVLAFFNDPMNSHLAFGNLELCQAIGTNDTTAMKSSLDALVATGHLRKARGRYELNESTIQGVPSQITALPEFQTWAEDMDSQYGTRGVVVISQQDDVTAVAHVQPSGASQPDPSAVGTFNYPSGVVSEAEGDGLESSETLFSVDGVTAVADSFPGGNSLTFTIDDSGVFMSYNNDGGFKGWYVASDSQEAVDFPSYGKAWQDFAGFIPHGTDNTKIKAAMDKAVRDYGLNETAPKGKTMQRKNEAKPTKSSMVLTLGDFINSPEGDSMAARLDTMLKINGLAGASFDDTYSALQSLSDGDLEALYNKAIESGMPDPDADPEDAPAALSPDTLPPVGQPNPAMADDPVNAVPQVITGQLPEGRARGARRVVVGEAFGDKIAKGIPLDADGEVVEPEGYEMLKQRIADQKDGTLRSIIKTVGQMRGNETSPVQGMMYNMARDELSNRGEHHFAGRVTRSPRPIATESAAKIDNAALTSPWSALAKGVSRFESPAQAAQFASTNSNKISKLVALSDGSTHLACFQEDEAELKKAGFKSVSLPAKPMKEAAASSRRSLQPA